MRHSVAVGRTAAVLVGIAAAQSWIALDLPSATAIGMQSHRPRPGAQSLPTSDRRGPRRAAPSVPASEIPATPPGDSTSTIIGPATVPAPTSSVTWAGHRTDTAPPPLLLESSTWTSPIVTDEAMTARLGPRARPVSGALVNSAVEEERSVRSAVGRRPWDARPFQCFGVVADEFGFCQPGSDFSVPGTPRMSARWYADHFEIAPTPDGLAAAEALLMRFEIERRDLLIAVQRHMLERRGSTLGCVAAFIVRGGALTIVCRGESADLDEVSGDLIELGRTFWADATLIAAGEK